MNTPTKQAHTPGPIKVQQEATPVLVTFSPHPTGCIARCYRNDALSYIDAQRLAHCWNNHDALLEALQATIDFIDTYVAEIRDSKGNLLWLDFDATIEEARTAIQAATRGEA